MGPVSFEAIDAGADRSQALTLAGRLGQAGIRVMSVGPTPAGDGRWQIVVRSDDADRADAVIRADG